MRIVCVVACVVLSAQAARGQDSNYWSQHYGPQGELLAGLVVGSALDLSSVYYNPGGLAMREDPAFLLSVQAFQNESLKLSLDGGSGEQLGGGGFSGAPTLIAGTLPLGFLGPDTRLAWSYLTRQRFHMRVLTRISTERAGELGETRFERAAAELLFDQRMSEDWGGLTWSRRFGEDWGVGITQFVAYRSQRQRYEINAQGLLPDGGGSTALAVNELDYYHWRTLTKLGVHHSRGSLSLGLAVTTPSIGLFGSGKSGFTDSATRDATGDGIPDAVLRENFATGLGTDFASPWSVALGASWRRGDSRLHVTTEWFGPVDLFQVIEAIETGEPAPLYVQQFDSVVNVGLGFQHTFVDDDIDVFAAFATDFSASSPPQPGTGGVDPALSTWNLYHITGGSGFQLGSNRFTLGFGFAFGGQERAVNSLIDESEFALPDTGRFTYRRLKFVLGYSFGS